MLFSLLTISSRAIRTGILSTVLLCSFGMSAPAQAQTTLPSTLELSVADHQETLSSNDLASWFRLKTTVIPQEERSEIVDINYCPISVLYCDFSLSRYTRMHLGVTLESEPDRESIGQFVTLLAARVNQPAADAVFGVSDTGSVMVVTKEKLGRTLDEEKSLLLLLQTLEGANSIPKVSLPTAIAQPKISSTDQERLGLREVIGEGKSNFKGSPKNRVFNIKRSLEQYKNVLIAPGEEFSFVDYLGEVDGEHGYLPELVIKYNKTEMEFGGGVCQVSSTIFRAAIYSGLKITERRNHAYAVSYYKPIGMDATIYIPKPDLRFTNNTPGHILMQSIIEGDDLTFRFFGTRDGRTVKVDGPHILERGDDGSMKTVFTQEVNNKDGQNYIRDSFFSNYKSPSLFPHPDDEPVFTEKPKDWSGKQWKTYQAARS